MITSRWIYGRLYYIDLDWTVPKQVDFFVYSFRAKIVDSWHFLFLNN